MNNNFNNNLSLILQALNLQLLFQDYNNTDLMMHLNQQDAILNEQTNDYLKKIVKQNEKIIDLLERRDIDE